MPDDTRSLFQGSVEDIRFQFEVIKNLAESVRQQTEVIRGIQTTQVNMLERLAKIEANRINETVAKLEEKFESALTKIDALETERDLREGGSKEWRKFLGWWGPLSWTIGILFTVFFLLFRATGILTLPTDRKEPAPIVAPREASKGNSP